MVHSRQETEQKLKIRVGWRLVLVTSALFALFVLIVNQLSIQVLMSDSREGIEQKQFDTATHLAIASRQILSSYLEMSRLAGRVLMQKGAQEAAFAMPGGYSVALWVYHRQGDGSLLASHPARNPNDLKLDLTTAKMTADAEVEELRKNPDLNQVVKNQVIDSKLKTLILSASLSDQSSDRGEFVSIVIQYEALAGILATINQDSYSGDVQASGSSSTLTVRSSGTVMDSIFFDRLWNGSFLVDQAGKIMVHPNYSLVSKRVDASGFEPIRKLKTQKTEGASEYLNPFTHNRYIGAVKNIHFGGLSVVSQVSESDAFDIAAHVRNRLLTRLGLAYFFVLILGTFVVARTSTEPIRVFADLVNKMAKKKKTRDISEIYKEVAEGFRERDHAKEVLQKFHSPEVAKAIMDGELKLGGHRLDATVVFVDIRGFTQMSSELSPDQVVQELNEYLERMIGIITKNGGVVDKFIGDAILAVWGVPLPDPDRVKKAMRACIEMRRELGVLNQGRVSRGLKPLQIGMGVNDGDVIAGNIGSSRRMEFTIIGSTVNAASRIEDLTKTFKTDLLVSETVMQQAGSQFLFIDRQMSPVRGLSREIALYRVAGFIDAEGRQVLVPEFAALAQARVQTVPPPFNKTFKKRG